MYSTGFGFYILLLLFTRGLPTDPLHLLQVKENNDQTLAEYHAFKRGPEMREAAKRVSKRLSLHSDEDILSTSEFILLVGEVILLS